MIRRIAVRAIIFHQGKLLCVRQKFLENPNLAADYWNTPGGGLEEEESLVEGLEREITEELGVKPRVGNLLFIQQFKQNTTEHLEFFFNVINAVDFLNIDLTKTSHGSREIYDTRFVDPTSSNILPEFLVKEDIEAKIKNNAPPGIFSYL